MTDNLVTRVEAEAIANTEPRNELERGIWKFARSYLIVLNALAPFVDSQTEYHVDEQFEHFRRAREIVEKVGRKS